MRDQAFPKVISIPLVISLLLAGGGFIFSAITMNVSNASNQNNPADQVTNVYNNYTYNNETFVYYNETYVNIAYNNETIERNLHFMEFNLVDVPGLQEKYYFFNIPLINQTRIVTIGAVMNASGDDGYIGANLSVNGVSNNLNGMLGCSFNDAWCFAYYVQLDYLFPCGDGYELQFYVQHNNDNNVTITVLLGYETF